MITPLRAGVKTSGQPGLITSSGPVLSSIASTFGTDFQRGQHWS